MPSKKRKRKDTPTIHPCNRYSENPPDFGLLASLYPSFREYVFYSPRDGRARIDWTDFNATRELTRILLLHDHGVNWWIPDGQLCPTVPNRLNYIHWIEDLISSCLVGKIEGSGDGVKGFDIGTGANCIYPLLGASLRGWSFVASDVTDVALEWAKRNIERNPHLSDLIEVRKAGDIRSIEETSKEQLLVNNLSSLEKEVNIDSSDAAVKLLCDERKSYQGPPVLVDVVRDGEKFDFCMCNPPFFESISDAGLNPKTSCGGTLEEMVCHGGEEAFISRIIADSSSMKQSFRWFTSLVGKKASLKHLTTKLREVGVSVLKTTEFVQGYTCRWGLAWSFMPLTRNITSQLNGKSNQSFMLEGLHRQFGAVHVLKLVESFFVTHGASCKCNLSLFTVDINALRENCDAILNHTHDFSDDTTSQFICDKTSGSDNSSFPFHKLSFRVSVFEQIPGTLLLKGSLLDKESPISGLFSLIFQQLEESLKRELKDQHGTMK